MALEVNRNILIAVDESENAERAATYVGKLLGGLGGFKVTVLHVAREPEEDFFPPDVDRDRWYREYRRQIVEMLRNYRNILIECGFSPDDVSVRSTIQYHPSIAECIMAESESAGCGTIVVGRKGISHLEEFLFGSVSGKIVRAARNCTIWVVS